MGVEYSISILIPIMDMSSRVVCVYPFSVFRLFTNMTKYNCVVKSLFLMASIEEARKVCVDRYT